LYYRTAGEADAHFLSVAFLLGGLALGFVPQIPKIHIPSQYMLAIFLPPLLMDGAFLTFIP